MLNAGWSYHEGDLEGPEAVGLGDGEGWRPVDVPHSFIEPYWRVEAHFGGVGWYHKQLTFDESQRGKRVHLEFEGAFQVATVYVNGQLAGEHKGGYTGFSFDITEHIKFGGSNTLAVRVDATWNERIAPRTGDFVFIGGLYRDVYLVTTDPIHIPWHGTFVSTPFGGPLTDTTYSLPKHYDRAPVRAVTEVRNDSADTARVRLETSVLDADGVVVAQRSTTRPVPAGQTMALTQMLSLDAPRFWSPRDPYLYTVDTRVYVGERLSDTYRTPLGVRWFQATSREGFWLNGERLKLRGFNVHQDHAGWGYAVTDSGFYRDIRLMRDAGANFIRGSHYPKDPALIDACDRFGLALMQELPYWGRGGFGGPPASPPADSPDYAPFRANVEQQLKEMIRSSRNNPSVLFWSLTNEPTGGQLSTTPLHEIAKRLDPTRPTTRVMSFSRGKADTYGNNGYYPGQRDSPVFFSELWGANNPRPGKYEARRDPDRPYSMGTAYWPGFDYGTHHDFTQHQTGVADNARLPKRGWHWHRAAWLGIDPPPWPAEGKPARLRIAAEKTLIGTNGQDDTQLVVTVLDQRGRHINAQLPVTLQVVSGPGRFPTGDSLTLETADGTAGMSFRAYEPGTTVIEARADGVEAAKVELTFVEGGIQVHPQPEAWPAPPSLPDGPDLAQGRPATASTQQPQHPASNAVDASPTSRWCAANGEPDQWWQVDLGRSRAIGGVGLQFEQHANYRFVIETSADGKTWTLVADRSDTMGVNHLRYVPLSATARYVRIRYIDLPPEVWASHTRFLVYPAKGAGPAAHRVNSATNAGASI